MSSFGKSCYASGKLLQSAKCVGVLVLFAHKILHSFLQDFTPGPIVHRRGLPSYASRCAGYARCGAGAGFAPTVMTA